jgi:DNA replication protein DnaC
VVVDDPFRKLAPEYLGELELPKRYATARVADIRNPAVLGVSRDYCTQFDEIARRGVAPLLLGPVQTYKTYAAAAVTRYVHFYAQVPARFVSVPETFGRLERRRFDPAVEHELSRMKAVTFLVLDDFPLVGSGNYAAAMLVEVVTHRFDAMLPTLMTGNLWVSPEDVREVNQRFGPQFGRRLLDMSTGFAAITHPDATR